MPSDKRAGEKMKELRKSRRWTMRDVYEFTREVAAARHSRAFLIPPSRLSDIETKGVVPNIYRLYTLSFAYETSLEKLLRFYGLEFRRWKSCRHRAK
jgi:transcriptional regulator with XRE-family HTH domain